MKKDEDILLWNAFSHGDDKAYCGLYNKYVQLLYQYGLHISNNKEIIKDSIQELFTRIYQRRARIEINVSVRSYLLGAFKNLLLTSLSREAHYQDVSVEEHFGGFTLTVEEEYLERETSENQKEKIREMLRLLSPRQQETIYLRFVKELSINEISEIMTMNSQSVQNLLQRSFKKIKTTYPDHTPSAIITILISLT